ncbi:MAG: DUF3822 family protein [Bacteroidales bacterium]|nr:DUF3822 family protein [Bacteroidales bacterium]
MFTLVPVNFFNPAAARDALSEVMQVKDGDKVDYKEIPQYGAELIYISDGTLLPPEIFFILEELPRCPEYNKLLCSWKDGILWLAVAQGKSLLLANCYPAQDFTTAQYYIFLALKSLQLNPEVTTIHFRHSLPEDAQLSLYRYFKSVECLTAVS